MFAKKKAKKKPAFRMKTRPVAPIRIKNQSFSKNLMSTNVYSGVLASRLVNAIQKFSKENEVALKDFRVDYYGRASWKGLEPIKDYEKRVADYKKKMELWERWAKDYKEEIKAYEKAQALKQAKATAKKIKTLKSKQDKIDEELLKLQKDAQRDEQLLYDLSQANK